MARFVRFTQYKGENICVNGDQVAVIVASEGGGLTMLHPAGVSLDEEDAGIRVYGSLEEVARKLES